MFLRLQVESVPGFPQLSITDAAEIGQHIVIVLAVKLAHDHAKLGRVILLSTAQEAVQKLLGNQAKTVDNILILFCLTGGLCLNGKQQIHKCRHSVSLPEGVHGRQLVQRGHPLPQAEATLLEDEQHV